MKILDGPCGGQCARCLAPVVLVKSMANCGSRVLAIICGASDVDNKTYAATC